MRPGYKQTEIGPIPEDWEVVALGDLCTVITKGTTPTSIGSAFTSQGVAFLKAESISESGQPISEKTAFIDERTHGLLKRSQLAAGDLLFSIAGVLGRVGVIDDAVLPANTNQALAVIRLRSGPNPQLVFLSLRGPIVQSQLRNISVQAAQANISLQNVRDFLVPLPTSMLEQDAIAAALSDVEALLGGLDRLIAKKRDLKQAAMQQLLTGQTRLPGFASCQSIEVHELGMFPRDWAVSRLKDLVDPSRGIRYGIVQPGAYDPDGRFMIRGQDYSESKGWADPSEVFRVGEEVEKRYRSARVQRGDLIMTIVGYCGHVEVVPAWLDGANLTQTTARIAILPDKASPAFCKYMLQSATGKRQVASFLKGAAQPGLNCGDVEKFRLALPTPLEQTAIAAVISDMDAELLALEARRDKTRALKQAMMQELLTGRTRLVRPEQEGAAAC